MRGDAPTRPVPEGCIGCSPADCSRMAGSFNAADVQNVMRSSHVVDQTAHRPKWWDRERHEGRHGARHSNSRLVSLDSSQERASALSPLPPLPPAAPPPSSSSSSQSSASSKSAAARSFSLLEPSCGGAEESARWHPRPATRRASAGRQPADVAHLVGRRGGTPALHRLLALIRLPFLRLQPSVQLAGDEAASLPWLAARHLLRPCNPCAGAAASAGIASRSAWILLLRAGLQSTAKRLR